jgi:hypothetical protein
VGTRQRKSSGRAENRARAGPGFFAQVLITIFTSCCRLRVILDRSGWVGKITEVMR